MGASRHIWVANGVNSRGRRGPAQPFLRNLTPEGALAFSRSVRRGGAFDLSLGGEPSDALQAACADAPAQGDSIFTAQSFPVA